MVIVVVPLSYSIMATDLGTACDVVLNLTNADGEALPGSWGEWDYAGAGEDEIMVDWACGEDGIYYLRVNHFSPGVYGEHTEYDLQISRTDAPFTGFIEGIVTEAVSGEPVEGVRIWTDEEWGTLSGEAGRYRMGHPAGTFTIWADKNEFDGYAGTVTVPEIVTVTKNIKLGTESVDVGLNPVPENEGNGGCGCSVFASNQEKNPYQFLITGLIYLLPFGFITIRQKQFRFVS